MARVEFRASIRRAGAIDDAQDYLSRWLEEVENVRVTDSLAMAGNNGESNRINRPSLRLEQTVCLKQTVRCRSDRPFCEVTNERRGEGLVDNPDM